MPSFDVVSQVDKHELTNAVDTAGRDIANRFDLRGTSAKIEREDFVLTLHADSEFQLDQLLGQLLQNLAGLYQEVLEDFFIGVEAHKWSAP